MENQKDIGQIILAKRWAEDLREAAKLASPHRLEQYGYKIYSQTDEDGIINHIFERIGTTNKVFFEFGVGSGLECNTRALLLHENWRGAWVESNPDKYKFISTAYKRYINESRLSVSSRFLHINNIDEVISGLGLSGEIDLLSIDVDGNDSHLWSAITRINPRVVVIEYSARFGPYANINQEYIENYKYSPGTHIGSSYQHLLNIAASKGYKPVATGICGLNAFFVRETEDARNILFPISDYSLLFNPPRLEIYYAGGFRCA